MENQNYITPWKLFEDATKFFKNIQIQDLNRQDDFSKNTIFYICIIKIVSAVIDHYFFNIKSIEDDCPICHDIIDQDSLMITSCSHKYHKNCLSKWLSHKRNCPVCRHDL